MPCTFVMKSFRLDCSHIRVTTENTGKMTTEYDAKVLEIKERLLNAIIVGWQLCYSYAENVWKRSNGLHYFIELKMQDGQPKICRFLSYP